MKQKINKFNAPQPTDSQLERAETLLKSFESSIDLNNFKSYENAFLQVLSDIVTIDKLHELGINEDQSFSISHSASFQKMQDAERFARLVSCSEYLVEPVEKNVFEDLYKVLFVHSGTFALDDILTHTMSLDWSAMQMHGEYDGWDVVIDYIPLQK
ncbi:ribonuclease E inhibitor RraB [Polaromonas sp. P1(28)-13]|nr:ribonuclease E inhibitor RraB [Polaromonas sp. P1(28)-13]